MYSRIESANRKLHLWSSEYWRRGAGSMLGAASLILFVVAFLSLRVQPVEAQVASGSITGSIIDPSGAVVSQASITATNTATGVAHTTKSDGSGIYDLPSLRPGSYQVNVVAHGFGAGGSVVTVVLNQASRADFKLQLAGTVQSIQVSAGSAHLETQSHQVSSNLSSLTVEHLPSGHDLFTTLTTAPNVISYTNSNSSSDINFFGTGGNSLTIGGTTYGNTSYLQDGVMNYNVLTKTANLQPAPEDVQDVSIQSNGASARFDQPAVVNVVTKGGTNHFHGMAYDYLENDALNAKSYYNTTKAPLRYNEFGANIGGPIVHNKLFFFFAYDGLRTHSNQIVAAAVPTAAERQGDFSADNVTIYDPSTYDPTTGTISPFPGNRIPSNEISSFATKYLAYYPLPTGSSVPNDNFQTNGAAKTTYNDYLGRLDYTIGGKDEIYGAFERVNPTSTSPSFSASPIFRGESIQDATNGYVQETHTLSSRFVNVARFGYNRSKIYQKLAGAGTESFSTQFGLPFVTPAPSQELPPVVGITRYSGLGSSYSPDGATQNLYQFSDEFNAVVGKHNFYIGADVAHIDFTGSWVIYNNGALSFNGQYTSNHNTKNPGGGSAMADFLLGFPSSAYGARGYTLGDFKQIYFMPYVQDNWRVTPKMTVNLGLRYDFYQAPSDSNGHSNVYDVYTNTNHPGTYHQAYFNLAPRIGAIYSINDKTVIRGGYGIYYSTFMYNELQYLMANPPNYFLQTNTFNQDNPTPISQVFAANPTKSGLSPFTTALEMPTPYVQQWNLVLQRSLGTNWIATVGYLGNKFTHIQGRMNPNQAAPPSDPNNITPINSRRPYPWVGDVYQAADRGFGNYNGLQADVKHRFANGFTLDANYVWSKAMDNDSSDNFYPRSASNLALDYARADFDRTHVLKVSGVYMVPIGKDLSSHLFTRELVGGWETSGTLWVASGTPFGVLAKDLSDTGSYHMAYADQVCNGNMKSGRSFAQWFNTSCFVQPGVGELGNAGRNDIIGPRDTNVDLSAAKQFGMGESRAFQIRGDFLGALNHPQGAVTAYSQNIASPNYGRVTTVRGSRVIELSAKFLF